MQSEVLSHRMPQILQEKLFEKLLQLEENKTCADCPAKSPMWCSIDFGVFICMNCSTWHRALTAKFTRVKSIKLDSWDPQWFKIISKVGNKLANQYWEYKMPKNYSKPLLNSSHHELQRFVQDKYIKRKFCPPNFQSPVEEYLLSQEFTSDNSQFNQMEWKNSRDSNDEIHKINAPPHWNKFYQSENNNEDLINFDENHINKMNHIEQDLFQVEIQHQNNHIKQNVDNNSKKNHIEQDLFLDDDIYDFQNFKTASSQPENNTELKQPIDFKKSTSQKINFMELYDKKELPKSDDKEQKQTIESQKNQRNYAIFDYQNNYYYFLDQIQKQQLNKLQPVHEKQQNEQSLKKILQFNSNQNKTQISSDQIQALYNGNLKL